MQVFLSNPSFVHSVRCLDTIRLRNQVLRENKTLLNGGCSIHPAAKIWADYKPALALYSLAGLVELQQRGFDYWEDHVSYFQSFIVSYENIEKPPITGHEPFHAAHRSQLLIKGLKDETFHRYKGSKLGNGSLPTRKQMWDEWGLYFYYEAWEKFGKPDIKDTWYGQFDWEEQPGELEYIWSL